MMTLPPVNQTAAKKANSQKSTRVMFLAPLFVLLASIIQPVTPVKAQGTLTIALQQSVDINGQPLAGCQLYIYVVGTVATLQGIYLDPGLTIQLPNPLSCDQTGRLPMFYLASGSVHVRLTDAGGVALFDYPSMLVIGPSGGGGGGGPVDPTTVMSTGDIKFRATGETLTGWVKMNATTIGNATSGATQRANADTQNLYVYLWMNCAQNHCPVIGGQGGSALADFNASKPIQVPDWRGTVPMGLDDMGNSARGLIGSVNMTAPDTPTTPNGVGGEATHLQQVGEMPSHTHAISGSLNDPGHTHDVRFTAASNFASTGATQAVTNISSGGASVGTAAAASHTTGITLSSLSAGFTGGGTPFNVMSPFMLGSWYIKL